MKRYSGMLAVVLGCALLLSPAWSVVFVDYDSPGPILDGTSWQTAFHTVQEGINASQEGGEVWVAAGRYVERITMKAGVSLYGGFTSEGGAWSDRNPRAHASVLDGGGIGPIVTASDSSMTSSTVFDGFTLTNASASSKHYAFTCSSDASPTVSNNIITGNGGGIMIRPGSSPLILNNTIGQSIGYGINYYGRNAVLVANNVFNGNTQCGVACVLGEPGTITLTNNTFVANGTAVSSNSTYFTLKLYNNIVSLNTTGIAAPLGTVVTLANNCVYGNGRDFSGVADPTGTNGNIKSDPLLANEAGDVHIQPDSPCRNAGLNSAADAAWKDIDGQDRILDGQVDIGADESDGVTHHYTAKPVFTPDGGVYYVPQTVTVTCTTEGAVIHYTTNGVDPTTSDPAIASGGTLAVDQTMTIKAQAWKEGWTTGPRKIALYKITGTMPAPVISLPSGSYDCAQYVTITCESPEAAIYYSLDGGHPLSTGAYYNGTPVRIDRSLTLKAVATRLDWQTSSVSSETYTLRPPGIVYVKADAGGATHDGKSWKTAYTRVPEATRLSVRHDEIWVARGVYTGTTVLVPGVSLYGGFAGNETSRSERNVSANASILDGEGKNNLLTADGSVSEAVTIDGFVIRNGNASRGGGIYCTYGHLNITGNRFENCTGQWGGAMNLNYATATVSGNTIVACIGSNYGGGLYVYEGDPTISDNTIKGCSAGDGGAVYIWGGSVPITANRIVGNNASGQGGAIRLMSCSPTIANNEISGNSAQDGGGIYVPGGATPNIRNNTIVANAAVNGGGIFGRQASHLTVVNNIIAFNGTSGVQFWSYDPFDWTFKNNCVYGNAEHDCYGFTPETGPEGNISLDPKLVSLSYGNLHVQPDSPCINAGDDSFVPAGSLDIDGEDRKQAGRVDIGSDESDGTTWEAGPRVIRVKPTGSDENDGSTWSLARRTVQAALNDLFPGGEVWLASGTYPERVVLPAFCRLLGGFNGTENSSPARNWTDNESILDGGQGGSVVTIMGGYKVTEVDGLTITNGRNTMGGGVYCLASGVVKHNKITGNTAGHGGGIYSRFHCDISENLIGGNTATSTGFPGAGKGGGVNIQYATLKSNLISDNNASTEGGGVYVWGPYANNGRHTTGYVLGNTVSRNISPKGAGICTYGSDAVIQNNIVTNNAASNTGGALYCDRATVQIHSNTIVGNTSPSANGTVVNQCYGGMRNCIVAFNSTGVINNTGDSLYNNCVFGNNGMDYIGVSSNKIVNSLSEDPLFVDLAAGDFRLQAASKCVDAGDPWLTPADDFVGRLRPLDGNGDGIAAHDIGCYEFCEGYASLRDAKLRTDGLAITIDSAVVTASFADRFYVETDDRTCGIGVLGANGLPGTRVSVQGMPTTLDGERLISPTCVVDHGAADLPGAFLLNCEALGGGVLGMQSNVNDWRPVEDPVSHEYNRQMVSCSGLNTIGLLVKMTGRVTNPGDGLFYLDSGCTFDDGNESVVGIRVDWPFESAMPDTGRFIEITGISSCTMKDGLLVRLLRPVSVSACRALD